MSLCDLQQTESTATASNLFFSPPDSKADLCCWRLIFFLPRYLPPPSADGREILHRDRKCVRFYNSFVKYLRVFHKTILGTKTCKSWRNFRLQTSATNIFGRDSDIQNQTRTWSTAILPRFLPQSVRKVFELWSTNYRDLDVLSYSPKSTFFSKPYFDPWEMLRPKFLHALVLLAHSSPGTWVPLTIFTKGVKNWLKLAKI